jgi:uncharacterized protein
MQIDLPLYAPNEKLFSFGWAPWHPDHVFPRPHWLARIESAWQQRPIVWLAGVRRTGKTTLARALPKVQVLDCELPSVRRAVADPESFLHELGEARIVLDEIHRLDAPAELLKLAADHFEGVRVLATGSSTLLASDKFRDTLTGRKHTVRLTPMDHRDLAAFQSTDLRRRLHRGGLPPMFLATRFPEADFQEWFDSYWAKDLQELFRLERRTSFQKLLELTFRQSGGIFEAAQLAAPCGISRPTVQTYLAVMEQTLVVEVLRPFHSGRSQEIVRAPKVYGFDTGFICFHRGWERLRDEDLGLLWEHYVLGEMRSVLQSRPVHYWRDKARHELDFVVARDPERPTVIEAKWSEEAFDPSALAAFRTIYPEGDNLVVARDVGRPHLRRFGALAVRFVGIEHLAAILGPNDEAPAPPRPRPRPGRRRGRTP